MSASLKTLSMVSTLVGAIAISGCAATGTNGGSGSGVNVGTAVGTATNVGINVFKSTVDAQCRLEVEKQNAWRIAKVTMTTEQQATAKDKVCGCVSEQAPQHVTVVEMTNAAIDAQYRAQLVTMVVTKSLQSCYSSIIKR